MTGAYLRVMRKGKFVNVEVEYLTDEERENLFLDETTLLKWLNYTCRIIADLVPEVK